MEPRSGACAPAPAVRERPDGPIASSKATPGQFGIPRFSQHQSRSNILKSKVPRGGIEPPTLQFFSRMLYQLSYLGTGLSAEAGWVAHPGRPIKTRRRNRAVIIPRRNASPPGRLDSILLQRGAQDLDQQIGMLCGERQRRPDFQRIPVNSGGADQHAPPPHGIDDTMRERAVRRPARAVPSRIPAR